MYIHILIKLFHKGLIWEGRAGAGSVPQLGSIQPRSQHCLGPPPTRLLCLLLSLCVNSCSVMCVILLFSGFVCSTHKTAPAESTKRLGLERGATAAAGPS